MKTKMIGTLAIAGLIAMAVFVGTTAADNGADINGSRFCGYFEEQSNFNTTDNLFGHGDFGEYSFTYGGNTPCKWLWWADLCRGAQGDMD